MDETESDGPILLEDVFKRSGIPTYTFVPPLEYEKLTVALRTAGRGVIIEGPSGIGKTTAVVNALRSLGQDQAALTLSARKKDDRDLIAEIPSMTNVGVVIIDDFHRLETEVKAQIADFLKVLADEERADVKLIVVGINRVGDTLVSLVLTSITESTRSGLRRILTSESKCWLSKVSRR